MKNFADSRGDIIRTEDLRTNLEHRVTYDSTGRLISKDTLNLATANHTTDRWLRTMEYDYDLNNNLTRLAYADTNGSNVTTYTYGEDNLPQTATFKGRIDNEDTQLVYSYSYDKLGRLINTELPLGNKTLTSAYTYAASVGRSGYTTNKLSTETVGGKTYRYAYDALGNITRIYSVNGSTETLLHLYTYDNNSQLTADMNPVDGTITDYSYDDGGNILQVKVSSWDGNTSNPVRGTEISRNTYSYTDDEWADLLTSYNGQTITYDAIGNPLNYRDGISLTWQNGRELATYTDGTNSVSYSYEAGGMRTAKAVTKGTTTDNYKYIYENGLLMQMRCNNIILDFTYGADGRPIGFAYRASAASTPSYYYYALNSRGDVVGLYNSSGALIVNYKYDAYGKLLGITNSSGSAITAKYSYGVLNPLRYRSYVYDTETGFYYLQSRYYDPTTCRFVNADSQLNTDSFTGFNQFAYCENNPIMHIDPIGTRTFECCPYGDCPYCKSCTPINPSAPDEAYCYIAPNERFTIVNHVNRTSITSPELMLDFGWHTGKAGMSITEYTNKGKKPGLFHSFAESGSDSCEGGVGININDWLAVDVGGRYNYEGFCNVNVFADIQITPWINFENSIGTDGYGRLLGITKDNTRANFELKTGWFALAYAYAFAVAPDVAVSAARTYGPSYSYAYSY